MKVEIRPSLLKGRLSAPPSKSMAHRLLICAGLAKGSSHITGVAASEDVMATLDLLQCLGSVCQKNGDRASIQGTDPCVASPTEPLNCRECGSTLRFFIPICLLSNQKITLTGSDRLFARPLTVYEELCREKGLYWNAAGNHVTVQGPLSGGVFTVAGNISSQFISGLLFALPLCREDSEIRILPPLESKPYLDMTIEALNAFGVSVVWKDEWTLFIKGGQSYRPRDLAVEGDFSNAAFFEALRYLGHDVSVENLNLRSLQGDKIYLQYFPKLAEGAPVQSIRQCPDLGPILIALAAAQNGATLTDTQRLRIKESDRGVAMAEELKKLGATVRVMENEIVISRGELKAPSLPLCGHNDHRIVMALAVLLTRFGGVIEGAQAVQKSLPEFFDLLRSLGCILTVSENDETPERNFCG